MATSRKDFQGRVLRKGEIQRKSDKRYVYTFTDPFGKRKSIYATTLKALRMKEDELKAMNAIREIINRGNSAEVNKTSDGKIRVYEVKKSIAKAR